MEQVVARGIRWLDSGAALALVVRGETLARLAEQMRDSHGGRISFQSNTWAALLIAVDEDLPDMRLGLGSMKTNPAWSPTGRGIEFAYK